MTALWQGIAALGALLLVHCVFETDAVSPHDGGGVETNTLVGVVQYPDGRPAAHARIALRPENYLQDPGVVLPGNRAAKDETFADNAGRFVLTAPTRGKAYLEFSHAESEGALLIVDAPPSGAGKTMLQPAILMPTGSITGTVHAGMDSSGQGWVQVYGLDRIAAIQPGTGFFRLKDLPKGTYSLRISFAGDSSQVKRMDGIQVPSGGELNLGPVFMGWSQSRTVLFNTTASGAGLGSSLVGFPVMVRLDRSVFDFSQAQGQGQDLRFYLPGGKLLPHETSRWDSAGGLAEVWVRLDTLKGNASTSVHMAWGHPSAADRSDGKAVFDSGTGAKAVFHFDLGSGLSESTGNLGLGTNDGAALAPGLVGMGFAFTNPSPNIMTFPHWEGLSAGNVLENPQGCTFSWWMYPEEDLNSAVGRRDILAKGLNWDGTVDQDWAIWIENGRITLEGRTDTGWTLSRSPAPDWQAGQWVHVALAYDGKQVQWHVNGAALGSPTPYDDDFRTSNDDPVIAIGKHHPAHSDNQAFKGILDEVRIYGVAASAAWIKASYYAQRPEGGMTILAP